MQAWPAELGVLDGIVYEKVYHVANRDLLDSEAATAISAHVGDRCTVACVLR